MPVQMCCISFKRISILICLCPVYCMMSTRPIERYHIYAESFETNISCHIMTPEHRLIFDTSQNEDVFLTQKTLTVNYNSTTASIALGLTFLNQRPTPHDQSHKILYAICPKTKRSQLNSTQLNPSKLILTQPISIANKKIH